MAIAVDESKITYSGDGEANLQNFDVYTKTEINSAVQGTSSLYDESATYTLGSYCIYNNTLYRSTTAITTPEPFTSSHWESVSLSGLKDELSELGSVYTYTGTIETVTSYTSSFSSYFTISVPKGIYLSIVTAFSGIGESEWFNVWLSISSGAAEKVNFGGKVTTVAGGASPAFQIFEFTENSVQARIGVYNYTTKALTNRPYTIALIRLGNKLV